jgi:hypothetical protein
MKASAADVHRSIKNLSATDHVRLHKAAEIAMRGTAYRDPVTLLEDTVAAAHQAAVTRSRHCWDVDEPFLTYMFKTTVRVAKSAVVQHPARRTPKQSPRIAPQPSARPSSQPAAKTDGPGEPDPPQNETPPAPHA